MFYPVSSVDLCLTGKGAKTPLFAVLSSDLKKKLHEKNNNNNNNIDYTSLLN